MLFLNGVSSTSNAHNNISNGNPSNEVVLDQSGSGYERINSLTLYIPSKIDIDDILQKDPPNFNFNRDHFVYILHLIVALASRKRDAIEKYNGFTILNAQLLQKRNHEYKKYLKYLIDKGIIICDNLYVLEEKSKGYKISNEHQSEIKPVTITKWTLIKSIVYNKEYNYELTEDLSFLKNWFNPSLKIDMDSALMYLETEYNKEKFIKSKSENAEIRYNARLFPVLKIHNQDYNFHVDNKGYRLHTNISQTKSELRKFFSYEGKKLCAVDIKNSQPFLSISLLDSNIFLKNNMQDKIINSNLTSHNNYPIMLVNFIKEIEDKPDVIEFRKMVESGKFYEEFGRILIDEKIIEVDNNNNLRKIAKDITFTTFFSSNKAVYYKESVQVFKAKFPNVYKIFSFIKKGRKKHNTLAVALQRLEAELVLSKTCKIINITRPNIPIWTLHDSIITTEENIEFVQLILFKVLKRQLGVAPQLKIEPWC